MRYILPLAMVAAGCNPVYVDLIMGRYEHATLPPVCFDQDGIAFRAEACPDPAEMHAIVVGVADLGQSSVATFDGWTVAFFADVEGAAGATTPHDRLVVVEAAAVLPHELFHAMLWETTGDLDEAHADARWHDL